MSHEHCCCCSHKNKKASKKEEIILYLRIITAFILFILGFKINILFIIAYIIAGYDVLFKAFKNLFTGHLFDECFLMAFATFGAVLIQKFPEAVMVMLLYQIGENLQKKAINKSKTTIKNLADLRENFANLIINNEIKKTDAKDIKIDDVILIKPGEKIPLDGIIIQGETTIDKSSLTGEFMPEVAKVDTLVYSGTLNQNGTIKVKVTNTFENSAASKIIDLLEHAQEKKTKTEQFITRFARIYTPIVALLAILLALIPYLILRENYTITWVVRALTFLVISCPCALVLSIPLSFFAGCSRLSKEGILIKGTGYIEKLSKLKTAVFDKTGTLTKGNFEIVKISSDNPDILKYASIAESISNHPIALAIKNSYKENIILPDNFSAKEKAGFGIEAELDNKKLLVGSSKLISAPKTDEKGTVVHVEYDNNYLGYIVITDKLKENSKKTIEILNNKKIDTIMLTGDSKENAEIIQKELSLKEIKAQLLPEDKIKELEKIIENSKGNVTFMGDGINDSPCLKLSDVGISMGNLGADIAIEASDVVIIDDNPIKLISAIEISKKTIKVVKQNIVFALGIKILFLLLGAFGMITMWFAVFADVGVTILAIFNSLKILKIKVNLQ